MSDLIRRSDAIKAMEQRYQDILRIFKRKVKDGEKAIALDMIGCIKSLPSADRPQGEWLDNGDRYFRCSLCGTKDTDRWHWCHGCGHPMKGAGDEMQ